MVKAVPVVLCGGSGSRLFPLSTKAQPKQFLRLLSERSLLQETCLRVKSFLSLPVHFVCNAAQAESVHQHLQEIRVTDAVVLKEPLSRNTAPAICSAALAIRARFGEDAVAVIVPVDHCFDDTAFADTIRKAINYACSDNIVTLGIVPSYPETGFGYIRRHGATDVRIESFIEKPPIEKAQALIEEGNCFWNAGVFVSKIDVLLDEFRRHASQNVLAPVFKETWSDAEDISFDYAIMQKTKRGVVVPYVGLWNDIGSWRSVYDVLADRGHGDMAGNIIIGRPLRLNFHKVNKCLVVSEQHDPTYELCLTGLSDTVIVVTSTNLLVCPFDACQDVKVLQKSSGSLAAAATTGQEP